MNAHRNIFPVKTTLFVVLFLLWISNTCVLGKNPAAMKNLYSPVELAGVANVLTHDLCTNAIEILAGVPYYGSTANATGEMTSNCSSYDDLDVWHVFTPSQSGIAMNSLMGSSFDTTLAIYNQC